MKQPKRPAKAALRHAPDMTGRDGAIDLAAKVDALASSGAAVSSHDDERFVGLIGAATLALWSDLPRNVQELVFEVAVSPRGPGQQDETLREELAKFLHDHHKRTAPHEERE